MNVNNNNNNGNNVANNGNPNVAVAIDDGNMIMILGTNGIRIESNDSSAVFAFNPAKNHLYIGSGTDYKTVDLCIGGKIVNTDGKDLLHDTSELHSIIKQLQDKIIYLEEKLDLVFYAPGMPGYLIGEEEFNNLKQF